MNIKIKKLHPNAVIPAYAKPGDAGLDLTAVSKTFDKYGNVEFGTGIAVEIPEGFVGLVFPRSSNAKYDLTLSNSVGVIDSGYRGEIMLKYKPVPFFAGDYAFSVAGIETDDYEYISLGKYDTDVEFENEIYNIGDRIGQLIVIAYPQITFEEVNELSETERGEGSYGSTGTGSVTSHVKQAIFPDNGESV